MPRSRNDDLSPSEKAEKIHKALHDYASQKKQGNVLNLISHMGNKIQPLQKLVERLNQEMEFRSSSLIISGKKQKKESVPEEAPKTSPRKPKSPKA